MLAEKARAALLSSLTPGVRRNVGVHIPESSCDVPVATRLSQDQRFWVVILIHGKVYIKHKAVNKS